MVAGIHWGVHRQGILRDHAQFYKLPAASIRNNCDLWLSWQAFIEAYIVKAFAETMPSFTGTLQPVMVALCRLYAVTGILNSLGDFLKVRGYPASKCCETLQSSALHVQHRCLKWLATCVFNFKRDYWLISSHPDITRLVDWAQNTKLLTYLLISSHSKKKIILAFFQVLFKWVCFTVNAFSFLMTLNHIKGHRRIGKLWRFSLVFLLEYISFEHVLWTKFQVWKPFTVKNYQ